MSGRKQDRGRCTSHRVRAFGVAGSACGDRDEMRRPREAPTSALGVELNFLNFLPTSEATPNKIPNSGVYVRGVLSGA